MSPQVQIDAIVEGMEMQSDDMSSYLHRPSHWFCDFSNPMERRGMVEPAWRLSAWRRLREPHELPSRGDLLWYPGGISETGPRTA